MQKDTGKNIETILCEAIEIESAGNRRAYLDDVCGHNKELRREAEILIANHFEAGGFLECPVVRIEPAGPDDFVVESDDQFAAEDKRPFDEESTIGLGAAAESDSEVGTSARKSPRLKRTFGEYEILHEIGRGGMGVVYKARQVSLNRIVALKMILAGQLAGDDSVKRFHAEAEAAANLNHPGIVPIHEVGDCDGVHYYSMGYVDGISLQQLVSDGNVLPAQDAAELIRRVAEAIDSGHRRGVIHRDLKPANILLAESDRQDAMPLPGYENRRFEPQVTDFGLAKKTEVDSGLTRTGDILGTPSYMPPEQATGKSDQISACSDVYSLGAVLYCLLTGGPPFRAASVPHTLRQVIEDEPVPPRRVNSAVPRDLETICLKCLQKSPGRRYRSAQDLAADLRRYRDREPITARPVSAWERGWKWTRRRPAMATLTLAGLITLMAFVGLLVSMTYWSRLDGLVYSRGVLLAHLAWRENEIARARGLLETCPSHLRRWEWDYVDGLCRVGMQKTISPPESIEGLGPLVVWDTVTGEAIATLEGHTSSVTGVLFSPDGQQLATSSRDGKITLWDLKTGQKLRTIPDRVEVFPRVVCSPDGSRLATAHLCRLFPEEIVSLDAFCLSEPDGASLFKDDLSRAEKQVAVAESDGTLASGNLEELAHLVIGAHSGRVFAIAFSPDRQRLASAGPDGTIRLWDVPQCREILTCEGHAGPVYDVAFGPYGKRLASAGNDRTVKIWDTLTGRIMLTFDESRGHTRAVRGVVFHPRGDQVASTGADSKIKIWHVGSGSQTTMLRAHTGPSRCVTFRSDGKVLATAGEDGLIKLWRAATGELIDEINAHEGIVTGAVFSPDGRLLASSSEDRYVKIWNISADRAELVHVLKGHEGKVYAVSFSTDGRLLASAGHDGDTVIWDTATGRKHRVLRCETGPVLCVTFHPSANRIAVGGADFHARLWDWARSVETACMSGHERKVSSVALSPDGSRLVTGSQDGTVRLWRTANGREIRTLNGHSSDVTSVVFSPAGDRIASTSFDGTVKVWDPESGNETLSLNGQIGRCYCVAFSPRGHRIASANHDGTITLWGP